MIADHAVLHTLWQVGVSLALVTGVAGYLWGSFRKGRSEADQRTLTAQAERIDVLEGKVRDLEGDVSQLRTENATLQGENMTLRSVLRGDTVPTAMIEAMRLVAKESVIEVQGVFSGFADKLHSIETGMDHLLTKGGEE